MVQKIADWVSRLLVGGLFIFSGLIKLNDPIGTEIKMEEYFEVFTEDFGSFFHYFIPYALEIGMVMIILEIALGVAVLIYYKMNSTTLVLLLLMVFFTFLTGYSHFLDKVTDCGCFGDAIKLTPKESFIKDIVLMVFVLHLFWYRKRYVPVLRSREGHAVVLGTLVISFFLGIYAVRHLPFIDFRAYKVGNSIPQEMLPEEQPVIEYVFEKDGEKIVSEKYLSEEGYKYDSSYVKNPDKATPKITDYSVTSMDGEDITQNTFEGARLLFIVYNVRSASEANMDKIKLLTDQLDRNVEMLLLTSSSAEDTEAFRHEHQLAIPYAFTDATVLKTIIRSNPGVTLWVNGTVKAKWHHNDTPSAKEVLGLLKNSD